MARKLRYVRMNMDVLAWERNDTELEEWQRSLNKATIYREIANFISKYRSGKAVELHRPIRGYYNVIYRLEYEDGSSTAIRIPTPDEQVQYEIVTIKYVSANTAIPVPKIYHRGTAHENPLGLGPFMIIEYIVHETTLSHVLNDPSLDPTDSHSLDHKISDEKLEFLYRQMANIVLQLSTMSFPKIGPLVEDEQGHIYLCSWKATDAEHELHSRSHGLSCQSSPRHKPRLTFQQTNAVEDENDARDKYVARQVFRYLASAGYLGSESTEDHDTVFRIFSEDLRPSNVLVDKDLKVVVVIDWEFAYADPAELSSDPPWWLLLKYPEYWPGGYEKWMEAYEPRFKTFISVLQDEEGKLKAGRKVKDDFKELDVSNNGILSLSQQMQKSWESKEWMVRYAARNTWSFDCIYWRYLDSMYFGDNENADYQASVSHLCQKQLDALKPFVEFKMIQEKEGKLVQWSEKDARSELCKVMV
ncbi:phosphotransferase family [Fusarium sporotrichioides]|uniref:Phosphotransferase family n=1 Tax=Fusarium sporotrichioides TaxID=5514 RepID=A0A395SU00_FUSSP|nr:phosphotransferase family [Fusarium sporotrichioides]